jgi:hypothetical protein
MVTLTKDEKALVKAAKARRKAMRYFKTEEERNGLPIEIPVGRILAHNHVKHTVDMPDGENGFRCWTWPESQVPEHFMRCPCGWAGLPHYAWRDNVAATGGKCISVKQFEKISGFPIAEAIADAAEREQDERVPLVSL